MKKNSVLFFLFLIIIFTITIKLFYLQFFSPSSKNKINYLKTEKLIPQRGKIFDRNGEILADNQLVYSLVLDPKFILENNKKEELIDFLNNKLSIDKATLEAALSKNSRYYSVKKINPNEKKELEKKKEFSFFFEEEEKRFYPEASLTAHLIGFVGKNYQGENVGYFGVEGFYNKDLTGLPGLIKTERNLFNFPIFLGNQEFLKPDHGRNLYLTIDKAVQKIIKEELKRGIERYQAKSGCVVAANPINLEILGLSCLPDFDPNYYYQYSEDILRNPAVFDLFEPGSIFKPLIVAAALEEKKIRPNDQINELGPLQVGEYQIKTWNNKYEGKISITRVLEKSSNVGMVLIGQRLGAKHILKYLKKFGFGEKTDIDLQGEAETYLKPENQWYPIDYATVTFGQGIAATPIQMITAFSSIINGGILYYPHVVKEISNSNNRFFVNTKVKRRVLSENTSEIIKKMLYLTVENAEVNWKKIKPQGYKIGGKTGTAQVAISGYYDPNKTIASFIGFFPIDKPKIIVLVTLKEPSTSTWGSETAAPVFFSIARQLLIYYNIPPEE
jgi:cell division protein FtsI/penicillin-binding protein 2